MENKVFFVKETSYGVQAYPPGSRRKNKRRPGDNLRTWQLKNSVFLEAEVLQSLKELSLAFLSSAQYIRPEIMADLDRDIAEHGELWKELAKK